MAFLHLQTILFGFILSNLICTLVLLNLWIQNRSRYSGMGFWMVNFACNFVGMVLLALRGSIPDFFSMLVGNAVLVSGILFLFIGLERFLGRRGAHVHNYGILGIYLLLQAYFIYIQPSLTVRNILISAALVLFCSQIAWLLLRQVDPETRKITETLGYIAIAFCVVGILRIGIDLAISPGNELFQTNGYEALLYLCFQMLYILLTFSLFILVNRRLHIDLEQDFAERQKAEIALQLSQEKYTKAFQSSPDAILISRMSDGKIIEANDSFYKLTGFTREEALANTTISLGIWANPQNRARALAELHATSRLRDFQFDVRVKSGKIMRAESSGEIIKISDEDWILSVIHDISEQKRVEAILQLRLKLWEFSPAHSTIEIMQKALDEIEELTDSQISFYHFVEEDQKTLTLQAWSTRTKKEFCQAEGEGKHYPIDEAGVWVDAIHQRKPVIHNDYASLPHHKGLPEGHAGVVRELVVPIIREGRIVSILGVGNKASEYEVKDIELVDYIAGLVWSIVSQKRADEQILRLNSQLEKLAMTDELTGLPNRRSFFIRGIEEINRARRYPAPLAIIMFDIDRFKNINDSLGHEYGDLALQCVAKIIREHVREVDLPARLGGEEFGILLPNTKLADATILAERLRSAVEEKTCLMQNKTVSMTASFGIAAFKPEMMNLDDLLRAADSAMYQAKNQGRNRVVPIS